MKLSLLTLRAAQLAAMLMIQILAASAEPSIPRSRLPNAVVDLRTSAGMKRLDGGWRYSDTRLVEVDHRSVGTDLKATGPANRTFDFVPDARATDFDDRAWTEISADSLEDRRGPGRLSMGWYRTRITVPERVEGFVTRGSVVVLEMVVDDYAEVWVNGKAPYVLGQSGGSVAAGWNAPNRVVLTRDARPGETFQIAVLAINGPISTHPETYLWVRGATVEFYAPDRWRRAIDVPLTVEHRSSDLDRVLGSTARLEKLADGFTFTEGPVWVPENGGYLLFSDPNNNLIYRLTPDGDVSPYLTHSGYTGADIGEYRQPGSNGLTLDAEGRLLICQHGHRRVVRIEKNGRTTVLADRFEGRRLNSPNDLVLRSDGTLFFTDPPFGLPKFHTDPRREIPDAGVYRMRNGTVRQVSREFSGPNGLAFSPDEQHLYVGNWDDTRKVVVRYPVDAEGNLGSGVVFADLTQHEGGDAIDGIKVDERGNVYVSGPGGLWIFNERGAVLGLLRGPEHVHNMAWGDPDGRGLYLAAQTGIYRLRLLVRGAPTQRWVQ